MRNPVYIFDLKPATKELVLKSYIENLFRPSKDRKKIREAFIRFLKKYNLESNQYYSVNDYEFKDYIELTDKTIPINKVFLNETSKIQHIIFDVYLNNQQLFFLSPRDFEKMVAELLSNKGFDVELTKQTRDKGYDILALHHNIVGFAPVKYLVECKRFNEQRKVGVDIIRSFKEVLLTEQANKGLIITTSYFSKDAISKQQMTPLFLELKDKNDVMQWISEYYVQKS